MVAAQSLAIVDTKMRAMEVSDQRDNAMYSATSNINITWP